MTTGVGEDLVGMDDAGHRETELWLRVIDRMATDDCYSGKLQDFGAAFEDIAEEVEGEDIARPAHELQRGERAAPHRVDVGESIGDCDPAPISCLVDDWCKEIHRLNERDRIRQPIYTGVVRPFDADQEIGMGGGA